jgi:hypothetical protein
MEPQNVNTKFERMERENEFIKSKCYKYYLAMDRCIYETPVIRNTSIRYKCNISITEFERCMNLATKESRNIE